MNTETNKCFDIVIVGLGKTGYSSACFFAKHNMNVAVTDNRKDPPMLEVMQQTLPDIPLFLGEFDKDLLTNAKQILVSPGISMQEPEIAAAIASGVKACGDVEIFCQYIHAPVVAVTGSNGKSTVTTLVAEMAKAAGKHVAVGGNIGIPVFDLLEQDEPDIYVLELSSFQLETLESLNALVAVVLNVSEDHLDRYSEYSEYVKAKSRIYAGDGTMVINNDDDQVVSMAIPGRNNIGFTLAEPTTGQYGTRMYDDELWLVKADEKIIAADHLRIKGKHNIANALAALAMADAINLPRAPVLKVLKTFPGLPHRCQWVARVEGVDWYDDSKATNVAACCAAITGLTDEENIILIAGGEAKGDDFSDLAAIVKGHLRSVIVIGRDRELIKSTLQDLLPVYEEDNLESAVNKAKEISASGDLVLLSPACASFDMFEDYRARGQAFISAVEKLKD